MFPLGLFKTRTLISVSAAALTAFASCSADFAPAAEMRYNIEPGQVVPYRVTIVVDTPTEKDTMSGIITFTGKQSEADQAIVAKLKKSSKAGNPFK